MRSLSLGLVVGIALAVPLTSTNTANVFEPRSVPNVCSAVSTCIPFTIDVTWGLADPTNAGSRSAILVNGTFPGPALRMKVGECVDFLVLNNLPVVTGVHFHGIDQRYTPWADGVPGVSQYAIGSGKSYMYRWYADQAGAFFYHSHYKGQIMDGLYGAIYISPADDQKTPFSMIDADDTAALVAADSLNEPLFASDWTRFTFAEIFDIEQRANIDVACADAIVINGMGSQYCLSRSQITAMQAPAVQQLLNRTSGLTDKGCLPTNATAVQGVPPRTQTLAAVPPTLYDVCTPSTGQNYTLTVDAARRYAAITFFNPGGFSLLKASIDNHKMWVYAYNGQYIIPQLVDQVNVGNGDRVSIFVSLNQMVGDYPVRIANNGLNQILSGFASLSYRGSKGLSAAAVPSMLFNGVNTTAITPFNPAAAAPFPAIPVHPTSDRTIFLRLAKQPTALHAWQWQAGINQSYNQNNDDLMPYLFKDPSTIPESAVLYKTKMGQWIDFVMVSPGPIAQPHPMHKHSNKFYVIGQGVGDFTWASVADAQAAGVRFNLDNPPYVDGYTTIPGENTDTWTVIRYKVEVPGAFHLHCHMQTHLSGGMAIVLLDGVDAWPQVPADVGQTCQGGGVSNSSWTGSCHCPSSCPGNSATGSNSYSSTVSASSDTTSSVSGEWVDGHWSGATYGVNTTTSTTGSATGSQVTVKAYLGAADKLSAASIHLLVLVLVTISMV